MRLAASATGMEAMRSRLIQYNFKQKRARRSRRAPAEPGRASIPV